MKRKKLKIEGDEKIKIELLFNFDEILITVFEGSNPTKYTDTLKIQKIKNDDLDIVLNYIAEIITKLYSNYLSGKEIENKLNELFLDKEYIELVS